MNKEPLFSSFPPLKKCIVDCRRCKRLVHYRETVPPRKAFEDEEYWRKPVPGFGDEAGWLLLTGLAPAAHGGNRTGRIFTGDNSALFLIKMLYEEGFANQPFSIGLDDGLKFRGCYMTAAVKCVPPDNRPTKEELIHCHDYYLNELMLLKNLKCVLALGKFAFDAFLLSAKRLGFSTQGKKFKHGTRIQWSGLPDLYASYHPSPQNTNTGKLTEAMFRKLLQKIKADHA